MQNSVFVVNDEPYCIWEIDLSERNMEFLDGIDTDYLDYLVKIHGEAEDEKRASIALRAALHHAIETMFSLLGAYIQAPTCAHAWVAKCSNNALREIVGKIDRHHNTLFTRLNIESVTWDSVAKSVFSHYLPETEKNSKTAQLFASFWKKLANEFTEPNQIAEYNSIKHGFRIRSGGFSLAIGREHEYGIAPPPEEMKWLGASSTGSTFFKVEPVGEGKRNRSLRSKRVSLNWSIEKTILQLQLISMSIKNITSSLKIVNGATPITCKFVRPQNDTDFDEPWSYSPTVSSINIDFVIPLDQIRPVTKSELLRLINEERKNSRS